MASLPSIAGDGFVLALPPSAYYLERRVASSATYRERYAQRVS